MIDLKIPSADWKNTIRLISITSPILVCVCRWLFGELVCQLYAMCGVLFGLCSLTNLTALSSVCCLKVCHPNHGEGITALQAWCH